jgi:hypothetical protein
LNFDYGLCALPSTTISPGGSASIRIAAAASVFDDLHECLARERLLQTDIEVTGNVSLTDSVSPFIETKKAASE